MNTIGELKEITRTSVAIKSKDNFTLRLASELTIRSIVDFLEEFFGTSEKRKVIKVIFDDNEIAYLAREDFMTLVSVGTRAIGANDGATIPAGGPSDIKFIKLCCSVSGCKKGFFVTTNDDSLYCDVHKTLMIPCNEP